MPRYKLRTLLILLAIGPPVLGLMVWPTVQRRYAEWQLQQSIAAARRRALITGRASPTFAPLMYPGREGDDFNEPDIGNMYLILPAVEPD